MSDPALYQALEDKVAELGTANAAAVYFNISPAYLSQIRNSVKPMPEWMGIALGWRRCWVKMEELK